ncbi:MAG: YerC/YecD family TrpR-related protein [Lachnospiraceae bacterium]|jgi:TrpR-related protein YerC/YecD
MKKNINSDSIDRLAQAILLLRDKEECKNFLSDICTITEIQDIAQRFDTALMLDKGINYQAISKEIGVSTATISRVSRCLNYGNNGYTTVIERYKELKGEENAD